MKKIILCAILSLAACGPIDHIVNVESGDWQACEDACNNLQRLDCAGKDGGPGIDRVWGTEDDETCTEVCQRIVLGAGIGLNQECVADADSCEQVDNCMFD